MQLMTTCLFKFHYDSINILTPLTCLFSLFPHLNSTVILLILTQALNKVLEDVPFKFHCDSINMEPRQMNLFDYGDI